VPAAAPVSQGIIARIIYAAIVLGMVLFWVVAWYVGTNASIPPSAIPNRPILYLGLAVASAVLFGAAMYTAGRLTPPEPGVSQDEWWRTNLSRAIGIWGLIEAPAILGTVTYFLTDDFRALISPFVGVLLFVNYRPSRLAEG
jgi:hypothetical protein